MELFADLRDDQQFFIDHPGAVPITTAQVFSLSLSICWSSCAKVAYDDSCFVLFLIIQG